MAPVFKPTVSTMVAVLVACNLTAVIMWQLRGNADVGAASTIANLKAELARAQAQGVADHAELQKLQKTLLAAIAQQAPGGGGAAPGGVTTRSMYTGEVDPVVVVMCLTDSTQGQIDEIQVALKSMLYNAPPPGTRFSGLQIYFLAGDQISYKMVTELIAESRLNVSSWPIPTSLDIIYVGSLHERFAKKIVRSESLSKFWIMHRIGAWWRLMLPWMLPSHVKHVIYIDTDAWFRDNVAGMWIERNPDAMIQWGASRTSGVVMLNLKVMHQKMWPAYGSAACESLREPDALPYFVRKEINPRTGDQAFFQTIVHQHPALEANISAPYSEIHGAHTWRLGLEWWDAYEGGAVLHNNGGGNQIEWAYWRVYLPTLKNGTLEPPAHDRPVWRTATFFADLPWHWLSYHGATLSRVLGPGHAHQLKVSYSAADSTRFDAALDEAYTFWNRSLALVNATGEDCNQVFAGPSYAALKASGKAIGLADWVESGLRGPQ